MSAVKETEKLLLEERKVKALERIALSLDSLTIWFEEIDKEDWGERIQYYLAEFHKMVPEEEEEIEEDA